EPAVLVDAHAVVEEEDVLQGDDVTLHALDLGDVGDPPGAVPEPAEVHDEVDGRGHLLTDGPDRQVGAGHQPQRLEAARGGPRRARVSRGLFEWTVVSDPSWPVFMAWSMSRASPERHSPTTTRSGRMRRQFFTRSRMVTSPLPSMLGGRASMESTWSWWSWSS